MKHVRVQLETAHTEKKTSVPVDTSYWITLWDTYTSDFSSVEIQCWQEETEKIEELIKLSAQSIDQGLVKSITITLNEENSTYLRNNSIDSNGGLKWFTVFFYKEAVQILEIAQYGSLIDFYGVNEEEAAEFQKIFPENAESEYFKEHIM